MSFSRNFIEATPSDVAMLPEYDRLQIINDLANADSLAFRGNAINNYLRPFLKGVGTVGGALGGAAMGAPTGPGALFTGTLGAAGGNVLGDNIADAIAQLAGVPRSKGSLIDEIGYQTGNFAEGATLEAGGQVFNAALPFMAKVATPIASKSAELGLKALRSGEKVPAMVADVLGDSKFLEVFSRSPFFRKGLESVAKNPEKASSPIFRRMINQIGGRDAVIQLESMIRNEAKGAKPKAGAKLTDLKQSETADIATKEIEDKATRYFERVANKDAVMPYMGLGKIPKKTVDDIRRVTNEDVSDYTYILYADDLKHAINEHGIGGKKTGQGQIPLTKEDMPEVVNIVKSYDTIIPSDIRGPNNNKRFSFVKKKQNNMVIIVEMRPRKQRLVPTTIYKIGNKNLSDDDLFKIINNK